MWINYLKIAWRNLLKYKIFSALNIGGLAIGMAVAILIGTYIQHELTVNHWMPDGDQIHRVYRGSQTGVEGGWANSPALLANEFTRHFPKIEQATYLTVQSDLLLAHGDKTFYLDEVAQVDSNFLTVFEIPLLLGNPKEALFQPRSIIISETVAQQFFGHIDVIGNSLQHNDDELTITGVYKDLKGSTHLDYGVFMRIPFTPTSWLAYRFENYVRTVPNTSIPELEAQITQHVEPIFLREFEQANFEITKSDLPIWRLQALKDIHLNSQNISSIRAAKGNARYLYIFGFIGLLVLIVVAINYINLSTARAANRAKEIGVRKVSGAMHRQLIGQFLTESVVQSLIGTFLAIPLAMLALPLFNEISGRNLSLIGANLTQIITPLLMLSVFVGIIAGIYPALVLSGFQTVKVLKGDQKITVGGKSLRKALVVTQFMGVVVLVILTSVMYRQVRFMLDQNLGFAADQVMVIPMNTNDSWHKVAARQQAWEKHPGILAVSTASVFPGEYPVDYGLEIEGVADRYRSPQMIFADTHYARTLDLEMKQGRFFSESIASDSLSAFVVNEAFVRDYQLEQPIGTRIRFPWREEWGEIIGIIEDYHYEGLDTKIGPLAFYGGNMNRTQNVAVRFQPGQWREVLDFMQAEWPSIEAAHPIRYKLLDEQFAVQYTEYENMGKTFLYSAGLTIFVAMLGLFGLATFTAQKRTREIGIRKILGAKVSELTSLLIRQFVGLSLIASLIAIPVAFWLAQRWLADFAYQMPLGIAPFFLGCLLAVGITLLTVGIQSWRAASINPVESLRNE